jgi:chromosome segregation ATPase
VTTSAAPEATPEAAAGPKARSTGEASFEGCPRVEADVATAPNTDHDRIAAETARAQQSNHALKQQVAAQNDQIAGRKTEQAGLDKQVGDLRATLASLTAEHEQAAKAVADANTERDRLASETAAAQQSSDALKQLVAELNDQIAGRKTEQAGLDKEVDDLRAMLASLTAEHEEAAKAAARPKAHSKQSPPAQPDAAPAKAAPVSVHKPDGLVLYNKRVFHNGHLFLWHGAWRGESASEGR